MISKSLAFDSRDKLTGLTIGWRRSYTCPFFFYIIFFFQSGLFHCGVYGLPWLFGLLCFTVYLSQVLLNFILIRLFHFSCISYLLQVHLAFTKHLFSFLCFLNYDLLFALGFPLLCPFCFSSYFFFSFFTSVCTARTDMYHQHNFLTRFYSSFLLIILFCHSDFVPQLQLTSPENGVWFVAIEIFKYFSENLTK